MKDEGVDEEEFDSLMEEGSSLSEAIFEDDLKNY